MGVVLPAKVDAEAFEFEAFADLRFEATGVVGIIVGMISLCETCGEQTSEVSTYDRETMMKGQ
jgi:hypothetical protein